MKKWTSIACMIPLAAVPLLAQHEYTPTEAEIGKGLFINNCVYCHGPDGDQVPGIDLGHGRFKRVRTDEDLINVIRNGIEGTGMPAQTNMRDTFIVAIVAYLRSLGPNAGGLPPGGDAAKGKAVFEGKGSCLKCHRVRGQGSYMGPDLSDIGALRRAADLQRALATPGAEIPPQNRVFHVVLKSGTAMTGRILNQDSFSVQLIDSEQRLRNVPRTDLKEFTLVKASPMPSYKDKLSSQEMTDVLTYLVSLKGI